MNTIPTWIQQAREKIASTQTKDDQAIAEAFAQQAYTAVGNRDRAIMKDPYLLGFEIVDKLARKEIFIEGALAEHFKQGVQTLVAGQPQGDADALQALIDDYIAGYTALAQQPVVLH